MAARLSRWGVGPKIAGSSIACALVAGAITWAFPDACKPAVLDSGPVRALAIALLVVGLPMWLVGGYSVMRAYNQDQLVTSGIFALVRHPIYAAWIVWLLPGVALLSGSWPFLPIPVIAYAVFRRLIHREDEYLLKRFGPAYAEYRARVHEVLPIPRLRAPYDVT